MHDAPRPQTGRAEVWGPPTDEELADDGPRPGVKTSEFWLTVAVAGGAFLGAIADVLPPEQATIAAAVAAGLYAVARGWAKSGW